MTRTMYDSVSALTIPFGVDVAAGYVDGLYKWPDAWWTRFSSATVLVRIAVFADTDDGDFLDVERYDATPQEAPGWVLRRRAAGHQAPAVYMNTDTWPAVRAAFAAAGVPEPLYIVADYDNLAVVPDGAFGKQYSSLAGYDLSVIGDYWPGVDPAPILLDPRRDDMHVDLQPGKTTVFTNPAAVLGGTSHLCLACDFGDATVRVATFSLKSGTWFVQNYPVGRTAGAVKIPLPADTNKVSVGLPTGVTPPVGMDVFA